MKTYITYVDGVEQPRDKWVRAAGQNAAEDKAKKKLGPANPGRNISVAYTEV
jgi:hypothetical protein